MLMSVCYLKQIYNISNINQKWKCKPQVHTDFIYLTATFFSVNANAATLCNFEVMKHLQKIKDKRQNHKGQLATITYEVKAE